MRKLVKVLGLLTIAAALFIGCSGGNNEENGGGSGGGGQAANAIELSDGNWTVRIKTEGPAQSAVMYMTFHATVSGGIYTFTSGSMDTEMDMSAYAGVSDSAIEADLEQLNQALAGTGMSYTYDRINKKLFMCYEMDEDTLAGASGELDLSQLPPDVEITSNDAKTEYSFTITEDGATSTYTITKD